MDGAWCMPPGMGWAEAAGIAAQSHPFDQPLRPPRKRARLPANQCQVPGCTGELQLPYQHKSKVCGPHLKAACVLLDGRRCRFCQKCGRFQALEEFDGDKRTCRAALETHNARRRKQPRGVGLPGSDEGVALEPRDGSNRSSSTAGLGLLASLTGMAGLATPAEQLQLQQLMGSSSAPYLAPMPAAAAAAAMQAGKPGPPPLMLPPLLGPAPPLPGLRPFPGLTGTYDSGSEELSLPMPAPTPSSARGPAQGLAALLGGNLEALASLEGLMQLMSTGLVPPNLASLAAAAATTAASAGDNQLPLPVQLPTSLPPAQAAQAQALPQLLAALKQQQQPPQQDAQPFQLQRAAAAAAQPSSQQPQQQEVAAQPPRAMDGLAQDLKVVLHQLQDLLGPEAGAAVLLNEAASAVAAAAGAGGPPSRAAPPSSGARDVLAAAVAAVCSGGGAPALAAAAPSSGG